MEILLHWEAGPARRGPCDFHQNRIWIVVPWRRLMKLWVWRARQRAGKKVVSDVVAMNLGMDAGSDKANFQLLEHYELVVVEERGDDVKETRVWEQELLNWRLDDELVEFGDDGGHQVHGELSQWQAVTVLFLCELV